MACAKCKGARAGNSQLKQGSATLLRSSPRTRGSLSFITDFYFLRKMINPDEQFWVVSGYFSRLCTQHIFDWDQRRWIGLQGEEDLIGNDEAAIRLLKKVYYQLPPDVVEIRLSENGTMASVSTNIEDDPSQFVHYPHFAADEGDLNEQRSLRRSQLQEVDRLGRGVDLVRYSDSGADKQMAFKYQLLPLYLVDVWDEAHIVHALQRRTSIVSFDKFVVDDLDLRLLGYTYNYVAGQTLRDNPCRPFRLSWLKQLTQVVDDLNLKYGICHQDIAPWNLMIDPQTDKLTLLDFDKAIQIGVGKEIPNFSDVDGVILSIYEVLTFDMKHQRNNPWDLDVSKVENMIVWPLKAELEPGLEVTTIRQYLDDWVSRRRSLPKLKHYTEASEPLHIPSKPPQTPVPCAWCTNDDGTAKLDAHGWGLRSRALQAGQPVIRWERTPDARLSALTNAETYAEKTPVSTRDTALHSASLAHNSQDCGCGYYDYKSASCGHLGVRFPFMCGATTDEQGITAFCKTARDSRGMIRKIKVEAPVDTKCCACNGLSSKIVLWD